MIVSSQEPEPVTKVIEKTRGRAAARRQDKLKALEESVPASPEVLRTETPRSRIRSRRNISDSPPAQQVNIFNKICQKKKVFVIVLFSV